MHIPFCKQACTYCNFHFATSLNNKKPMVNAIIRETKLEKDYLAGESIETIYFGGGTPSLLGTEEIQSILNSIRSNYCLAQNAEITLEANPDDISSDKLKGWKDAGINRLSIGVQSFFEEELRWMNRAHNSRQARECLELSLKEFDNITMDLIYGSPLLSDEMWKQNVDFALALGIPHLSCYALTVEEKTPLHKMILKAKTKDVEGDKQARQFLLLMQWLREKNYEHYEVSNFALTGYRSRHNSSYWKGEKYLGIGPSAHSYNERERRWNIANNQVYLRGMEEGIPERSNEILTELQKLNEYIMISLRTIEGMDLKKLEAEWGSSVKENAEEQIDQFRKRNLLKLIDSHVCLTDEGMLMADGIASELFSV